jgi:Zn-finger nucleic acid-binding protein
MSERQGIEIDYCPKCRGIWLDRGELDKIIERSSNEPTINQQPSVNPFQQGGQPYGYRKPYKQKHWLSELFD